MRAIFSLAVAGALVMAFAPFFGRAAADPYDYRPESVGAVPELHIKPDGTMLLRGAKVNQIVGTTLFAFVKWGLVPLQFAVTTDAGTAVTKRYGGASAPASIAIGHYLDVEGAAFSGSDFLGVRAEKIKDYSIQTETETFSGRIERIDGGRAFVLTSPSRGSVNIRTFPKTTIKKGAIDIPGERLAVGDVVIAAQGLYDYKENTLAADLVYVYHNRVQYAPRNYQGTLRSIFQDVLSARMAVDVGGRSYAVEVPRGALVLRKDRSRAELARFVAGDTVRFYGPVREQAHVLSGEFVVDAEVVRNLNL